MAVNMNNYPQSVFGVEQLSIDTLNSDKIIVGNGVSITNSSISSYSPTTIANFEETTVSITWTQSNVTTTSSVRCQRMGSWVQISSPQFTISANIGTAAAKISGSALPTRFRPAYTMQAPMIISAAGTAQIGLMTISTSGVIDFASNITGSTFGGLGVTNIIRGFEYEFPIS